MSDTKIDGSHHPHRAMEEEMERAGLLKKGQHVDPSGKLYQAEKRAQDAQRRAEVNGRLALEGGIEIFKHVPPIVGAVKAAIETIEAAVNTVAEGDRLNDAVKREYAVGAAILLAGDRLPAGFRVHAARDFVKPGAISPGAQQTRDAVLRRPDGEQVRKAIVAATTSGQVRARDLGIESEARLAARLAVRDDFSNRYHEDVAFRLGVDSYVWACAHGDERKQLESRLPESPKPAAPLPIGG